MVGGGEGAFIGAAHRMAAALDGEYALVCGAFSSDVARNRRSAEALVLDSARAQHVGRIFGRDAFAVADPLLRKLRRRVHGEARSGPCAGSGSNPCAAYGRRMHSAEYIGILLGAADAVAISVTVNAITHDAPGMVIRFVANPGGRFRTSAKLNGAASGPSAGAASS